MKNKKKVTTGDVLFVATLIALGSIFWCKLDNEVKLAEQNKIVRNHCNSDYLNPIKELISKGEMTLNARYNINKFSEHRILDFISSLPIEERESLLKNDYISTGDRLRVCDAIQGKAEEKLVNRIRLIRSEKTPRETFI